MKTNNLLLAIIVIAGLASCKKNTGEGNNTTSPKLQYTGSSEALSEGREILATKTTGDYVCFVSGKLYTGGSGGVVENANISATIDVINSKTNTWNKFNIAPARNAIGTGTLNNKLIVAGGRIGTAISDAVNIYDLTTGAETTHKLSLARYNVVVAGSGDKILFAGGGTLLGTGYSKVVDIYDIKTGQWSIASLSKERSFLAATAVGNKIFFAGGTNGNQSDVVDIYDVPSGSWSATTISNAQILHSAFTAGGKAFFTSGVNDNSPYGTETVDIYDASKNVWTLLTLAGNKIRVQACASDEYAFFTSGPNGDNQRAQTLTIYNIKTGQTTTKNLPYEIASFAMSSVGNKLVLAGGSKNNNLAHAEPSTGVIIYDVKTNSFDTTSFTLPAKVTRATGAANGNKIFIAGGLAFTASPLSLFLRKTVSTFELK